MPTYSPSYLIRGSPESGNSVISLAKHVLYLLYYPRTLLVLLFPVTRPHSTVVLTFAHSLKTT